MTVRTGAVLVAAVLAASACRRCGPGEVPPLATADAGSARALAPAPAVQRPGLPAADLRQAVLLTLPEFRGITGLYAVAVVERRYAGALPPGTRAADALAPGLAAQGWKPAQAEGKPLVAEAPPFFLEALEEGGHPVVRAGIIVPGEKVVDILQSPAPLGSQSLAQRMPPLPEAGGYEERFLFEAHYRTRPETSGKMLRQLVTGLVGAGWTAAPGGQLQVEDTADGGLPEALEETLSGPHAGRMTLARNGERVTVSWEQPLTSGRE